MSNAAGRNEEATGLIHCFPEGLLCLFDSSCFAKFSKVFDAGFSITCPVRFLEVDVRLPRFINSVQFGVDGMKMGKLSLVSEVETDQSDRSAISMEAKLMTGEVDRQFVGSRVA